MGDMEGFMVVNQEGVEEGEGRSQRTTALEFQANQLHKLETLSI